MPLEKYRFEKKSKARSIGIVYNANWKNRLSDELTFEDIYLEGVRFLFGNVKKYRHLSKVSSKGIIYSSLSDGLTFENFCTCKAWRL